MPLSGQAAMLLTFNIQEEAIAEHDDWHTHEHLPERLAIPGFLRGTRWVAPGVTPRYLVLYEVEQLQTLASAAYRQRLDHPTPWTKKMMPHYRDMTRGLCSVVASVGLGMGSAGLLIRFKPLDPQDRSLESWLVQELMPTLPVQSGLGSVHLLRSGLRPEMTTEQRLRGSDAGVDLALLVTGYAPGAVAGLAQSALSEAELQRHGATDLVSTLYQAAYALSCHEVRV